MLAKQLRCEVWVIPEGDRTGENAIECKGHRSTCVDCGESVGCVEHAVTCPRCGTICYYCADEHRCVAKKKTPAVAKRLAPCQEVVSTFPATIRCTG